MNRGRSARRRAKRRRDKTGCASEESLAIGATGFGEIEQPHALVAPTAEINETAFAPEGSGAPSIERDRWLEIRAVRERYPVSKGMLQRIAHQTMEIALQPNTATRDKLIAAKLIITMADGNRTKGLPEQVTANVTVSLNEMLDAMGPTIDAIDHRVLKTQPGDPGDYAD